MCLVAFGWGGRKVSLFIYNDNFEYNFLTKQYGGDKCSMYKWPMAKTLMLHQTLSRLFI